MTGTRPKQLSAAQPMFHCAHLEPGFCVADDGENRGMERARPEEAQTPDLPTPAERRAFKLLPLAWIVVFVLAAVILYLVFS